MQLRLLDLSGKETSTKANFEWLDINSVSPSDDNPRLSLNQEVLEGLVSVLKDSGWATVSPIAVRKVGNGYEVVDGHHRLEAANQAGATQVLCNVLEMTEEEAVVQRWVLNNQTEFKDIEKCLYFYKHTKKDSKLGLSRAEFAKKLNAHRETGRLWANVGEVLTQCQLELTLLSGKTRALSHIHKTPQQYWQQLTGLLIENEWSVKQTEEICKAIKDIEIPNYLQFWLSPDAAIKQTINEALRGEVRTPRDIKNWVTEAEEQLENLPESRKVIIFDEQLGTEEIQYLNLKTDFLDRLPSLNTGDRKPSAQKIKALAKEVLDYAQGLDDAHARWLESKASEEEQAKQREAEHLRLLALQEKFAPIGINAPLQSLSIADIGESKYDAIITDVPYLLSNDGITVRSGKQASVNKNFDDSRESAIAPEDYMGIFFEALKMGGYFVTTCTIHTLPELITEAIAVGFEFREKLVWYKRNAPPLLTADRFKSDHEDILVFVKPGATPYFGYEDIKLKDDTQRGATIDIPQCGGNERLKWHDTQKPLELYELLVKAYCPKEGQVLEPFGGSGTTVVACKKLGRICTWIEQDESFFNKANDRIEDTSFHWEL